MKVRMIGLIGLCATLAACNPEPAEDAASSAQATGEVAGNVTAAADSPVVMEPAPEGLPSRIAREVIAASGQTCAEIANAERAADGTVTATCSGGETYLVYTAPGQGPVATPR